MENLINAVRDSLFAIVPLAVIILSLQFIFLRLSKKQLISILYALLLTFIGLTLFLYGVDISFVKISRDVGASLALINNEWIVVIIGFVLGFVITIAEPAVKILNDQIEDITSGYISKKLVLLFMSIGVAIAIALSIIRIYTEMPLLYIIIPGYILVFVLAEYIEPLFWAMAMDAGGVVTGPMISAVILALTVSMSASFEGRVPLLEGFGLVALVSLIPILSIMVLGLIYKRKKIKGGKDNE